MSERTIELQGPPEQAAAQLWAHIQEKTMLNGEKLKKFDSPEKAADVYLEHLTREQVDKLVKDLITTLQKMRTEREDIFEKNSALEDAVGKLIKENIYLQRQGMVKAAWDRLISKLISKRSCDVKLPLSQDMQNSLMVRGPADRLDLLTHRYFDFM